MSRIQSDGWFELAAQMVLVLIAVSMFVVLDKRTSRLDAEIRELRSAVEEVVR